ncbi:hypothetical protein FB451DRAFT_1036375, partial [Mycena latifolia]
TRYSNMDYIVFSALFGFTLMLLLISYDIACQWKKRMEERNTKMPRRLRLDFTKFTYQCALPVWHVSSHNEECKNNNSLSFKTGTGKSDGEGVKRVWAVLNPAAFHTKDAGVGQRVDVLEDKMDSHNYLKNIGQGKSECYGASYNCTGDALQHKLIVAIAEREHQVDGFKEVNATIDQNVRREWEKMIEEWLKDPATKPNPYTLTRKDCLTEVEVRLEVKRDEDAALVGVRSAVQGCSTTAFLVAGIQIEDAQCRIRAEISGTTLLTADREGQLHDWRCALLVKIGKFWQLQALYMPGAALAIATAEEARDPDAEPPKPERIKLFMPSKMDDAPGDPLRGCVATLLEMETKLRIAQCTNALVKLRTRLHAKRHLITFRNANVTGQIQSTKARTLIGQLGERVEACAERYHRGRKALIGLRGEAYGEQFRALLPGDVRLDGDDGESDAAARKALAMIGAGCGARALRDAPGTSKKVMSWIWTAGGLDDAEERLHDSVRVEWARARARKIRWEEEVMTLREEMRRVLRYLEWQAAWWKDHVAKRSDMSSLELIAGVRAYALKQAYLHERLAAYFERKWKMPVMAAGQRLIMLEMAVSEDEERALGLEEFFTLDPVANA